MTTALATLLALEILTPPDGLFVLDHSHLDGPDQLAASTDELTWDPILAPATMLHIERGGTREGPSVTVDVGTVHATFYNAANPVTDPRISPGTPVRVRLVSGAQLFTGQIGDIETTYDKLTDGTFVTAAGTDAVEALANVTRHGAATPVGDAEPWEHRAARILSSSPVPFTFPPSPTVEPFDGLSMSQLTLGQAYDHVQTWGGPGSTGTDQHGRFISRTPPNWLHRSFDLIAGERYRFDALVGGWDGRSVTSQITFPEYPDVTAWDTFDVPDIDSLARLSWEITAPGTPGEIVSGLIEILPSGLEPARLYGWWLYRPSRVLMADTTYQSSLVNHLDLVANSARARWYVDRSGVTRVEDPRRTPRTEIVAAFSDAPSPATNHVPYTQINLGYDTRAVVNDLTLSNRSEDGTDELRFTNPTSAATWGRRAATLDTGIYDAPDGPYTDSTGRLAGQLLDSYAAPRVIVRSVTFKGTDHPTVAAALEIYDRCTVTRAGEQFDLRALRLTHDITPDRWLVTVHFTEET